VNEEKTAKRGVDELARHARDPLLAVPLPGLKLTASSESAAYARQQDPIFPSSYPTTFTRQYDLGTLTAAEVFAAYEDAFTRQKLKPIVARCRVSIRTEQRTWGGTSLGDPVQVTVAVAPVATNPKITFMLDVNSSPNGPRSVGLRDCLTIPMPGSAFVAGFSTTRTDDELCAEMLPRFPGALRASPNNSVAGSCTLDLQERTSKGDLVTITDVRNSPLAVLLDDAVPETNPSAEYFFHAFEAVCEITVVKLPTGFIRMRSFDRVDRSSCKALAVRVLQSSNR
jgi:hypothetical protein